MTELNLDKIEYPLPGSSEIWSRRSDETWQYEGIFGNDIPDYFVLWLKMRKKN